MLRILESPNFNLSFGKKLIEMIQMSTHNIGFGKEPMDQNATILCYLELCSPFPKQTPVFMCLQHNSLENTVRKGEQFLLFPQCSCPFGELSANFIKSKNCLLQTLSLLKSLKFVF